MEKEIRNLDQPASELRATVTSRNVTGIAIVFNSMSRDLGGFREIILPEAVKDVLIHSDILCLLNHSTEKGVLARSRYGVGTLKLETDSKGVKYSFLAPSTSLGDEVLEGIKRNDIKSSSFAFTLAEGGDRWEKRDGQNIRVITKFQTIWDVSPCYRESYSDTSVALRSLDNFNKTAQVPKRSAPPKDRSSYKYLTAKEAEAKDRKLEAMHQKNLKDFKREQDDENAKRGFYVDDFGHVIPIKTF
jgi:hypothetical protein